MLNDESQIFTSGIQFIDVASDDSRRSTFHAISFEILLRQHQERTTSNLLFSQNVQRGIANIIRKFGMKVLYEPFRAPSFDVGDGRRLCGNDRASRRL